MLVLILNIVIFQFPFLINIFNFNKFFKCTDVYDVYDVYDDGRRYAIATNTSTSDIMKELVLY